MHTYVCCLCYLCTHTLAMLARAHTQHARTHEHTHAHTHAHTLSLSLSLALALSLPPSPSLARNAQVQRVCERGQAPQHVVDLVHLFHGQYLSLFLCAIRHGHLPCCLWARKETDTTSIPYIAICLAAYGLTLISIFAYGRTRIPIDGDGLPCHMARCLLRDKSKPIGKN